MKRSNHLPRPALAPVLAALLSLAGCYSEVSEYEACPPEAKENAGAGGTIELSEPRVVQVSGLFTLLWVENGKFIAPPASIKGTVFWRLGLWTVVGDDFRTTKNFSTSGSTPFGFVNGSANPTLGFQNSGSYLFTCAAEQGAPTLYLETGQAVRATEYALTSAGTVDPDWDRSVDYLGRANPVTIAATFVVSDGSLPESAIQSHIQSLAPPKQTASAGAH